MLPASTIQYAPNSAGLNDIARSIIRTLLYFRVFRYPIRRQELFNYVSSENRIEVQSVLAHLISDELVKCEGDFIWVMDEDGGIPNRLRGNASAEKYLSVAKRHARMLSWFPFIKCICVSGSLSKYYMDSKSDIDYFIIAKKRRLWLTKLLMSLIVETLELLRLEKYFCPNYIITENNLEITDRNIFSAMEIITLIPLYNQDEYERFLAANDWIREYFPVYGMNLAVDAVEYRPRLGRLWSAGVFTWFDSRVFSFYKKRFARKVRKGKIKAVDNEMVITENDFKLHLSGHRRRILQRLEHNIAEYEQRFGVEL
ncbi:MAG TPA: hypothetical protein VF145_05675 [Chitinophagaceae bacterium]